jgi:hypothetical protein
VRRSIGIARDKLGSYNPAFPGKAEVGGTFQPIFFA